MLWAKLEVNGQKWLYGHGIEVLYDGTIT